MQDSIGTPERRALSDRSRAVLASLREQKARRARPSRLETLCYGVGISLIAFFCAAQAAGEWERRQAVEEFLAVASLETPIAPISAPPAPPPPPPPAASAYSLREMALEIAAEERAALAATRADVPKSAARGADAADDGKLPVALLRIPNVGLEVPVFSDTSERNLNRGAGWIAGTSAPDAGGNFAIAAHRDQHFKVLEGVALGDVLEVQSRTQTRRYAVSRISVVEPQDVSVLRATGTPAITLVTCFPFRYVGPAPRRFIVQATELNNAGHAGLSGPTASQ